MASSDCGAETTLLGQAQTLPIGIEPNPLPRRPPADSTSTVTFKSTASVTTRPPNLIGERYSIRSVSTVTFLIWMSVGLGMRHSPSQLTAILGQMPYPRNGPLPPAMNQRMEFKGSRLAASPPPERHIASEIAA